MVHFLSPKHLELDCLKSNPGSGSYDLGLPHVLNISVLQFNCLQNIKWNNGTCLIQLLRVKLVNACKVLGKGPGT